MEHSDEEKLINKNLNRAAGARQAHRSMHKRENAIGKQIYYGKGITKKRQAEIRERLAKALAKKTDPA